MPQNSCLLDMAQHEINDRSCTFRCIAGNFESDLEVQPTDPRNLTEFAVADEAKPCASRAEGKACWVQMGRGEF